MNQGVNSNQIFRVFWTDDPAAFLENGLPNPNFEPNVFASENGDFPKEGWYKSQIIKFRGNFA